MKTKTDIMIVAAHPDDAEFGVGGSVARWTKEGKTVVYVVCTSGDKGLRTDLQRAQYQDVNWREILREFVRQRWFARSYFSHPY